MVAQITRFDKGGERSMGRSGDKVQRLSPHQPIDVSAY
jgi:hypothetical protein